MVDPSQPTPTKAFRSSSWLSRSIVPMVPESAAPSWGSSWMITRTLGLSRSVLTQLSTSLSSTASVMLTMVNVPSTSVVRTSPPLATVKDSPAGSRPGPVITRVYSSATSVVAVKLIVTSPPAQAGPSTERVPSGSGRTVVEAVPSRSAVHSTPSSVMLAPETVMVVVISAVPSLTVGRLTVVVLSMPVAAANWSSPPSIW